jgi:hypothetical protein
VHIPVFVALPPKEASDFVFRGARVVRADVVENVLRVSGIAVPLLASVPRGDAAGSVGVAGLPLFGRVAVSGIGVVAEGGLLTARGEKIPAESAVADAGLEGHDVAELRSVHAKFEADAELRTDRGFLASNASYGSLHELIVLKRGFVKCGVAARHNEHVADLRRDSPLLGGFVLEVRVHAILEDRVLERVVARAGKVALAEHVRLSHHHKHLNGLAIRWSGRRGRRRHSGRRRRGCRRRRGGRGGSGEGHVVDAAASDSGGSLPATFVARFEPAGTLAVVGPEQAFLQG